MLNSIDFQVICCLPASVAFDGSVLNHRFQGVLDRRFAYSRDAAHHVALGESAEAKIA